MIKFTSMALLMTAISTSLMAGGNASQETSARLDGLGLNSFQTRDNYNIWANPAFMTSYQSEATINVSGQDITKVMAGGNVGTSVGAFGIYFGRKSNDNTVAMTDPVNGVGYNVLGANATPLVSVNQFDLFYAVGLGESMDLGFRFSHKGKEDSQTNTDDILGDANIKRYTNEYEAELGFIFSSFDISLAIGLPNYYYEEELTTGSTIKAEDDSAMFVTLQGGYDIEFDVDSKLRINAIIGNASLDSKASNDTPTIADESRKESQFGILAGVTYERQLIERLRLFLSASLVYGSYSTELNDNLDNTGKADLSVLLLPIVGAVEINVSKSWQVRVGASVQNLQLYNNIQLENISPAGSQKSEIEVTQEMDVDLNFGLGYSPIKSASIDLAIRQGQLFGGSNVLDNLTSKITGTYRF